MTAIKSRIIDHFVSIFVHDVVAAVYELHRHRYALALSLDDERRLDIAVNFSNRSNITRNVLFCISTLDSILSDDLGADLATILLEESPMIHHSKSLIFFVPLVAEYIRFSRSLNPSSITTKCA